MKERGPAFLSTADVISIFEGAGIEERFVETVIEVKAIRPSRGVSVGKPICWGVQDVFRTYVCKIMYDEYVKAFPRDMAKRGSIVMQLRGKLSSLDFGGYRKFTCLPGWEKITKAAADLGMDFSKTMYAYKPPED